MTRCTWTRFIALTALLAAPLPAAQAVAAPGTSQFHRVNAEHVVPNSFIVVLEPQPGTRPAAVARALVRRHGGTLEHLYQQTLLGYAATMTTDEARRVAADPEVAYVEPNKAAAGLDSAVPGNRTDAATPWGLDRLDQAALPLDGDYKRPREGKEDVTTYIVDSGIRSTHKQFSGNVLPGYNATDDENGTKDCWGRGTGIAGVVGGQEHGVAHKVKIVPVRVGGCGTATTTASVLAAVEWITVNSVRPAVVSMSADQGVGSDTVNTAIRNSITNGLPWVIAIGDGNTDVCATSPGGLAEAITVAATDRNDARWVSPGSTSSGSNHGSCVDLFAPGRDIATPARTSDVGTTTWSGTSFAAAHTAGVAAIWLSHHPHATPAELSNYLLRTAAPNVVQGAGGSPSRLLQSS